MTISQYHLHTHPLIDCYGFLAIMNEDAMCTSVQDYIFSLLLGKYLGVDLLGPIINVCLILINYQIGNTLIFVS